MTGSDLRAWRAAEGLTQVQAAARVGVSLQTWWRWEHGWCRPLPLQAKQLQAVIRKKT